jgi:hypothetical protein
MTLTTSSNRSLKEFKETYLWSMKKSRGILALLALLMFIAFPMILMIGMTTAQNNTEVVFTAAKWISAYTRYITVICLIVTPLTLIFVTVIAVSQFSYLHQKRSVDLFHALPVGRVPMLLGRYCAGLTTLFVPILFNFAVASIIGFCYGIEAQYSFTSVAIQMLWLMLMTVAALTFSVFMAVCTGTTFDMVISILGINVAYPLLILVSSTFASQLLPGLNMNFSQNYTVLTALSPFVAAFIPFINSRDSGNGSQSMNTIYSGFLVWWIVLTLILLAGAVLLYRKRKSECAESNFAFPIPKVVIRFMITAVAGLGFGLILQATTTNLSSFFIGLVAGSLAAHIVVEAVYSRGFQQIRRSFVHYGIFAAAFLVLYGVLATGCFGYDTRLPSADQVESISISAPGQYSNATNYTIYDDETNRAIAQISPVLKDKANIGKVLDLHKALVTDNRKTSFPYSMYSFDYSRLTLTYHLKNGRVMERSYPYNQSDNKVSKFQDSLNEMTGQVAQMKEYCETASILFYLEPEYLEAVNIYTGKNQSKELAVMPDTNTKRELLEALKQDYLNGRIDNPNSKEENSMSIIIDYKNPITLKDGKLKNLLGGFNGKVYIGGNNGFQVSSGAENTKELVEKYGWDK